MDLKKLKAAREKVDDLLKYGVKEEEGDTILFIISYGDQMVTGIRGVSDKIVNSIVSTIRQFPDTYQFFKEAVEVCEEEMEETIKIKITDLTIN